MQQPLYKIAPIVALYSGDNLILAATGPINIYGITLTSDTQLGLIIKNGTAPGVNLTGILTMIPGAVFDLEPNGTVRYRVGAPGLYFNLTSNAVIGGTVYYTLGGS
jgi:hypothetical protein